LSLSDYQRASVDEWSHYVATQAIFINGVRAFNEGDAVPTSHVERGVVAREEVRRATETPQETATVIAAVPFGAFAQPDPDDVAAARAANEAAGVTE
jgi:hypothetical protein